MQNEKKYFASANTEKGFVSYFKEIYGAVENVYIIKGGPGTGKSHFIRSIADEAVKHNYNVEFFYCSSDPLSLDGIIIEDIGVAVIDGTSPHTYDPIFPGVRDNIINLGENWSVDTLMKNKKEICEIIEKKSRLYGNVYNYLAAAGRIEGEISSYNRRALKYEKMRSAVQRLSKGWKQGKGFSKIKRPIEGISHAGKIVYETYHELTANNYVIKDRYGIGGVLLDEIIKCASQKNQTVLYSPSVLDTCNVMALCLPEANSSFVIADDDSVYKKQINMDRFVDMDVIKSNKQKNRFARRCLNSLYEGVQKGFDEIFYLHAELEKYYTAAMDFSKNAALCDKVKSDIFK